MTATIDGKRMIELQKMIETECRLVAGKNDALYVPALVAAAASVIAAVLHEHRVRFPEFGNVPGRMAVEMAIAAAEKMEKLRGSD